MLLWRDDGLSCHAEDLARLHLSVELPDRWVHTMAVAALTARVAAVLAPAAEHILVAAAFLHDVGYSAEARDCGFHPIDGAEFAREHTFPESVVGLIAHHSAAWAEADERGLRQQLSRFLLPARVFVDVITYADLHTGPTGQHTDPADRIREVLHRYGRDHLVHRAVERSRPELLSAVRRVHKQLCERAETPMRG